MSALRETLYALRLPGPAVTPAELDARTLTRARERGCTCTPMFTHVFAGGIGRTLAEHDAGCAAPRGGR